MDYKQVDCPCNSVDKACNSISVPQDASLGGTLQSCINFTRSSPTFANLDCSLKKTTNYREQLNLVSSFLDASQVYGFNKVTGNQLRSNSKGFLRSSKGVATNAKFLPVSYDDQSDQCSKTNSSIKCFLGGETRTNENLGLVSMQTLFLREHNRIAKNLASINPSWDDERTFQEARKILIAIYQVSNVSYIS